MNNHIINSSEQGYYTSDPGQQSTPGNGYQPGQPSVEQYQWYFGNEGETFQSNDLSHVKRPMQKSVSDPACNHFYQSQQQLSQSSHLVESHLETQSKASKHNHPEEFRAWHPHKKSVEHEWEQKLPENSESSNKQHVLSELATFEMSCSAKQSVQVSTSQSWNAQLKDFSNSGHCLLQNAEQNMLTMAASSNASKTQPFKSDFNHSVSVSPCVYPRQTSMANETLSPLSSKTKYQPSTKPQTMDFSITSGQHLTTANVVTNKKFTRNDDQSKCHRWLQLPPVNSHQANAVNQNPSLCDNDGHDRNFGELSNLRTLRNQHEQELEYNSSLGELSVEAGLKSRAKGKFKRPHVDFPLEFWTEEMTFWFNEKKRLDNYMVHKKQRRGYYPVEVESKMKAARNIFKRLYRQRMEELSTRDDLDFNELKRRKDIQIKMSKKTEFRQFICQPPEEAAPTSEDTQPPSRLHWHEETELAEPARQQAVARVMEKVFANAKPFSRFHGLKDMVQKVTAEKEKQVEEEVDKYDWGKPYRNIKNSNLYDEKYNSNINHSESILSNTLQAPSLTTGKLKDDSLLGPPPIGNPGLGLLGDFPVPIYDAFQLAASGLVLAHLSAPKSMIDYPPNPRSLGPGLLGDAPVPTHDTMIATTSSHVTAHKDVQKHLDYLGSLCGPDILRKIPISTHDTIKPATSLPVFSHQSIQKKLSDDPRKLPGSDLGKCCGSNQDTIEHTTPPVPSHHSIQKKLADSPRKLPGSDLGKWWGSNQDTIEHNTSPVLSQQSIPKSRVVDIGMPSLYSTADRVEEDVTVPVEKHLFTGCPTQPHNSAGGPFKRDSFIVPPQDNFLPLRDADEPIVDNRIRDALVAPSKLVHYREGELDSGVTQGVLSNKFLKANYCRTPLYDPFTSSCLPENFNQSTECAVKDSNCNLKSILKKTNRPRQTYGDVVDTPCTDGNSTLSSLENNESFNSRCNFSLADQSSNITHKRPTCGADDPELQKLLKRVQVNLQKKMNEDNHYKMKQSEFSKAPQERESVYSNGNDANKINRTRNKRSVEELANIVMNKLSERKDDSNKSNGVITRKSAPVKVVEEQEFIGAVNQGMNISQVRDRSERFHPSLIQSCVVKPYPEHASFYKLNKLENCAKEQRENVSMLDNQIRVDYKQVSTSGNKVNTNSDCSPSRLTNEPAPPPDHRLRTKLKPAHNITNVSNPHGSKNLSELLRRIEVNLDKKMKSDKEQEKDRDWILSGVRQSRRTAEVTCFEGRQREGGSHKDGEMAGIPEKFRDRLGNKVEPN